MRRLALAATFISLAGSAIAADLGPYRDREYYAPPPPRGYAPPSPVVEERKVIEHHHYYHRPAPVPAYRKERVYIAPRVYSGPVYHPRRFAYGAPYWRHRHFAGRPHFWAHRGHRYWR